MKFTATIAGVILLILVAAACGPTQEQGQEATQEAAPSSFTVRITAVGLVGFVPARAGGKAHYLLVDTISEPREVGGGCVVPAHLPLMHVYGASCESAENCFGGLDVMKEWIPTEDDFAAYDLLSEPQDDLIAGWFLNRKHVGFPQTTAGWSGVQTTGNQIPNLPARREDARDFRWLADIPGSGSVYDDCLEKASDCPVVARVALGQGQLATCSLSAHESDVGWDIATYEFKTLGGGESISMEQAMADSTVYEMNVTADYLELELKRFDDLGAVDATLRLAPKNDLVEIVFTNVPFPGAPVDPSCSTETIDRHFELYYELTANENPRYLPHATTTRVADDDLQPDEECLARLPRGNPWIERPKNRPVCGKKLLLPGG